jgi:hypothetical protein
MCVAYDFFSANLVQSLQVSANLFEYLNASRAVHFPDVRRNDSPVIPAQCNAALHMAPDSKQGHGLLPRQGEFPWRRPPANSKRAHPTGDVPVNRVVGRPHDRAIVMQESIRYRAEPARCFLNIREHRFAAQISGSGDERTAERVKQQLVQWAVG